MTAPYKIFLFDDCCHLYTSLDSGKTWAQNNTPDGTLGDDWTDMYMAVNDLDFSTTALFNEAPAAGTYSGVTFDGSRGGVEIVPLYTETLTSGIKDYSYGTSGAGNYQEAVSGAITANGLTILIPPYFTDTLASSYPRISSNAGGSWTDVVGLPAGQQWTRACFAQGASVMYIHQINGGVGHDGGIWKSTDGGSSWTKLDSGPTFDPVSGESQPGSSQNSLRLRCSQNGEIVAAIDWWGRFYISTDQGATWTNKNFGTLPPGNSSFKGDYGNVYGADFGMSLDGATIIVGLAANNNYGDGSPADFGIYPYVWLSTDFGATWQEITGKLNPPAGGSLNRPGLYNVNVSTDSVALVVVYSWIDNQNVIEHQGGTAYVDISLDQGITFTQHTIDMSYAGVGGSPGTFVSAYIMPSSSSADTTPAGDPNLKPLVGATYRRTSSFTSEAPSFVGWHRHDFGHGRNELMSIGVSSDIGGLLDHLDMVSTDGTNYFVEGFTQIFDEDDALTDAWFLDGALVPDSAYEDTLNGTTGIRFTGLWYLRTKYVTVTAFGLDLGDFTVNTDGSVFVPYGSGTAPSSFDYTVAGAGAYLFTADYITKNVQSTAPRNGGVYISSGYMPCVVGYTFTSDGQILRPSAPEQVGTRAGSPFGDKRRSHYVKALLRNTIGIQFGTDFSTTLQQASLKDDAGNQPAPTAMYSGMWRETLNDDYTFDSMISWRIVRPYPASVISVGASIEGSDA